MKSIITALTLIACSQLAFAADESQEPSVQYQLLVNGAPHAIELNRPTKLNGTFDNPELQLQASANRTFTYGGVSFDYPAYFSWEANIGNAAKKSWTLSGNDFKIIYTLMPNSLSASDFAQSMATKFGKQNTRIGDKERVLGSYKLKGKQLNVQISGVTIVLEVFTLPSKSGTRLLVLQDSPAKTTSSKEADNALALLKGSFVDTLEH